MAAVKDAEIVSAAIDLAAGITGQVRDAEQLLERFEGGTEAFLTSGHGLINDSPAWSLAPLYRSCYTRSGVKTRSELDQVWKDRTSSETVRESVERVLDAEQKLKSFIDKLASVLAEVEDRDACPQVSAVGSQLPNLTLVDARSGSPVNLETYWSRSPFTHFVLLRHFA